MEVPQSCQGASSFLTITLTPGFGSLPHGPKWLKGLQSSHYGPGNRMQRTDKRVYSLSFYDFFFFNRCPIQHFYLDFNSQNLVMWPYLCNNGDWKILGFSWVAKWPFKNWGLVVMEEWKNRYREVIWSLCLQVFYIQLIKIYWFIFINLIIFLEVSLRLLIKII